MRRTVKLNIITKYQSDSIEDRRRKCTSLVQNMIDHECYSE